MKRVFYYPEDKLLEEITTKIQKQQWLQDVSNKMVEISTYILETKEDWLDERKGTTARKIGSKIGTLYTMWILTREEKYIKKACDIFDQAIARDFNYYYKELNYHLSVGDAVLAITMSYSLIYDYLVEEQKRKAEELLNILAGWLHETDSTWGLPQKGVTSCNHNSVHYGALALCGIVLENDEWLEHGKRRVKEFLENASDETGYFTEGFSYLNYGNMTSILFCEAYNRTFNEQLYDKPLTCNQAIAHMLPTPGHVLKVNDHGDSVQNMLPQVYLASRYKNAGALYLINQYEQAIGQYFSDWNTDMSGGFVYPFIYIFADEDLTPTKPSEFNTPKTQIFESGRVMARTKWDDPMAIHLSVSSGKCYHNGHNHADKGSFTIYGLGEEFLIDVGRGTNEGRGHNIMMVNGVDQLFGTSQGEILKAEDTEDSLYVVCDTIKSYQYTPQSLLGISRRNIFFVKQPVPFIVIRDDMQVERAIEDQQLFEFMMHTSLDNTMKTDKGIVDIYGSNYGNKCRLKFVYPHDVETKISDEYRTCISYSKEKCCTDCFKEAIASCKNYNPFLTTVIVFANKDEDFPDIEMTGDKNEMRITVKNDSSQTTVKVKRFEMSLEKGE